MSGGTVITHGHFLDARIRAMRLIFARPLARESDLGIHVFVDRTDLRRLSKDVLFELVIQLQRPDKTSRNSSKPPATDKKEKRENARPGGAKRG